MFPCQLFLTHPDILRSLLNAKAGIIHQSFITEVIDYRGRCKSLVKYWPLESVILGDMRGVYSHWEDKGITLIGLFRQLDQNQLIRYHHPRAETLQRHKKKSFEMGDELRSVDWDRVDTLIR